MYLCGLWSKRKRWKRTAGNSGKIQMKRLSLLNTGPAFPIQGMFVAPKLLSRSKTILWSLCNEGLVNIHCDSTLWFQCCVETLWQMFAAIPFVAAAPGTIATASSHSHRWWVTENSPSRILHISLMTILMMMMMIFNDEGGVMATAYGKKILVRASIGSLLPLTHSHANAKALSRCNPQFC